MKLKLEKYNPHRQSIIIMGKSQTHKTSLGKVLTKLIGDSGRKVIVFDPNKRWTEKREHEIAFSPNFVTNNIYGINLRKPYCIYQPIEDNEENFAGFCTQVMRLVKEHGFFTVIMDELHNNTTTFRAADAFKRLTKNCHNFDVGYIGILQRPQELIKAPISNADHLISFQLKWAGDIKIMKLMLGEEAERLFLSSPSPVPHGSGLYQNPQGKIMEFET